MSDTPQDPDKSGSLPVPAGDAGQSSGTESAQPGSAEQKGTDQKDRDQKDRDQKDRDLKDKEQDREQKESAASQTPAAAASVGAAEPAQRVQSGASGQPGQKKPGAAAGGKAGSAKAAAARPRRGLSWSLLFTLLLLVGLLAVGFYTWEQQKSDDVLFREYSRLVTLSSGLEQRLEQAESARSDSLRQLQEALAQSREQLELQNTRFEEMNRELVALRLRVSRQSGSADQAWMLTEAESLLRLAQQRLLHARDVTTAQSLFLSSDDVLRQIDDPSVQAVRELLLADLDALRGVRVPDIQTMYSQLGELRGQLGQLRLNAEAQARELSFSAPELAPDQDQGWFGELKSSLGQYFVITRQDNPVVPQLSPEQVLMTRQILNLYLEQARAALLQAQSRVYQEALDQVISVTEDYMQGDSKEAILARLGQLRDAPIVPMIPPVGSALNALRQISPGLSATGEAQQ